MKSLLAALLLFGLGAACQAEMLITDGYQVTITVRCPEGYVSCDRVRYVGTDRKTGKTITLVGSTVHTLCADGVTPCRFLGYQFRKGRTVYSVWDQGDGRKGALVVTRGSRNLLEESGLWQ